MHTESLDAGVCGDTEVAKSIEQRCCSQTNTTKIEYSKKQKTKTTECDWNVYTCTPITTELTSGWQHYSQQLQT